MGENKRRVALHLLAFFVIIANMVAGIYILASDWKGRIPTLYYRQVEVIDPMAVYCPGDNIDYRLTTDYTAADYVVRVVHQWCKVAERGVDTCISVGDSDLMVIVTETGIVDEEEGMVIPDIGFFHEPGHYVYRQGAYAIDSREPMSIYEVPFTVREECE